MDKPQFLIFKSDRSGSARALRRARDEAKSAAFRATHGDDIGIAVVPATTRSRKLVEITCDLIRSGWSPVLADRVRILPELPYDIGSEDAYFNCLVPEALSGSFVESFTKKLSETLTLKYTF